MKWSTAVESILAGLPQNSIESCRDLSILSADDKGSSSQTTLLISDQLEPNQVVAALIQSSAQHLFQKNGDRFVEEFDSTVQMMKSPADYFSKGVLAILPDPTSHVQISYKSPQDKARMKEESSKFVLSLNSQNAAESAEAIVEELYMNSVIDAPREAKKLGFAETSESCLMELAANENRLVISCQDPYGSLDTKKFFQRMHEVYVKGAGDAINLTQAGGAGLGCVILFEHSARLILGVDKGKATRVTCVVPVGYSHRQRAQMKKSLHRIEF